MKVYFIILFSFSIMLCGNIGLENNENIEHTIIVDGTNLRFFPESLTINEGDSVRFLWDGELLPHNSVEEGGLFNSGDPARNVDYLYTFNYTQSGIYDFYCEPHEDVGMVGEITVINVENEEFVDENIIDLKNEDGGWEVLLIPIFLLFFVIFVLYKSRIMPPENIFK